MARILVHLPYSAWSEKARWALDHHGVNYRAVEHVPLVFEPLLRLATRDLGRKITVPILFDGNKVLRDSFVIGQHAESIGSGSPLFPAAYAGAILAKNELAERIMRAGRARATQRLLSAPDALAEMTPAALALLAPMLGPVLRVATQFVMSKHVSEQPIEAASQAELDAALSELRRVRAGRAYAVGGSFSFADIALACALGFVVPHERTPFGPRARAAFSEPALAALYPELIAWRDQLVERHR